jgi:hypothetical protein
MKILSPVLGFLYVDTDMAKIIGAFVPLFVANVPRIDE